MVVWFTENLFHRACEINQSPNEEILVSKAQTPRETIASARDQLKYLQDREATGKCLQN
tara:strand:- start:209 stop:385 length:177 start_codon:yes stop_codon:yes gene_type:complete